jgi:hypothetical protein
MQRSRRSKQNEPFNLLTGVQQVIHPIRSFINFHLFFLRFQGWHQLSAANGGARWGFGQSATGRLHALQHNSNRWYSGGEGNGSSILPQL